MVCFPICRIEQHKTIWLTKPPQNTYQSSSDKLNLILYWEERMNDLTANTIIIKNHRRLANSVSWVWGFVIFSVLNFGILVICMV